MNGIVIKDDIPFTESACYTEFEVDDSISREDARIHIEFILKTTRKVLIDYLMVLK